MRSRARRHLSPEDGNQAAHLGGFLWGFLGGREGFEDRLQHELDERDALPPGRALPDGRVVVALARVNDALYGSGSKEGIPARQDQCLPETSHAAVAIFEGVDEFELVVENRTGDQGMFVGSNQLGKQVRHGSGNTVGGRRNVVDNGPSSHNGASAPIATGKVEKSRHECLVSAEKVGLTCRVPLREHVIGGKRIARFPNLPWWGDDRLSFEYGRDLAFAERIAFDGQGSPDRADAVDAPHMQIVALSQSLRLTERFTDPDGKGGYGRVDCVGRWRGRHAPGSPAAFPPTLSTQEKVTCHGSVGPATGVADWCGARILRAPADHGTRHRIMLSVAMSQGTAMMV